MPEAISIYREEAVEYHRQIRNPSAPEEVPAPSLLALVWTMLGLVLTLLTLAITVQLPGQVPAVVRLVSVGGGGAAGSQLEWIVAVNADERAVQPRAGAAIVIMPAGSRSQIRARLESMEADAQDAAAVLRRHGFAPGSRGVRSTKVFLGRAPAPATFDDQPASDLIGQTFPALVEMDPVNVLSSLARR